MEEIIIMPSDTYMITKLADRNYLSYDTLTLLYQPLLEADAYSLLMLFWAESVRKPMTHSVIFNTLNVNIQDFLTMRMKLEGIGLLRTYENHNEKFHSFIYELQEPLKPADFFSDEVLSTLLLDIVGEKRFQELAYRFEINTQVPRDYQEITSSFNDAYTFSEQFLASNQEVIENASKMTKGSTPKVPKLKQNAEINFEILLHSLNTRIVDLNSVRQSKEMIITLQKLYKIGFNDLVQLIAKAADLNTGQVTPKSIQRVAVAEYQNRVVEHRLGQEQVTDWRNKGFDDRTIEVFTIAVKADPNSFLTSIKEQKGGQETSQEFYTLRNAMSKSSLPIAAINIVIYWLLVVSNYEELPQKIFDSILDKLGQQDIIEVSEVWQALPKLINKSKSKNNSKSKKVVKAQWDKNATNDNDLSLEEIEKLRQELEEL